MKPHEDREARKEYARQLKDEKRIKSTLDDAIKSLLQHRNGREYIWWLLEITKHGLNPFNRNALETSFQCGEQNVGQQILAHILETDPDGYLKLLKERQDEQAMVDAQQSAEGDDDEPAG